MCSSKIDNIIERHGEDMDRRLSKKEFFGISIMLFGLLFGSGNLIFPPMLGNQSGSSMMIALIGFVVTAVIFPVLGILAVAKSNGVENLGARVGSLFSIVYPAIVFLAIGPGIAIPRNGSLAFEMSVAPYIAEGNSLIIPRLVYTMIFFGLAYFLSVNPGKMVDRMGKGLIPVLFILIIIFFTGSFINLPIDIAAPTVNYQTPFVTGVLEGYHTMDILAALNFGLVIALTIKRYDIEDEQSIIRYSSSAGLIAGLLLLVVYSMLAYVGMIASSGNQDVANGGEILFTITNTVFGSFGSIILILIFTLACLTTAVGLITSVSEYFSDLTSQRVSYRQWMTFFTLISFVLANAGLNSILKFSLPVLVAIYPTAIVLIVMALLQDTFNFQRLSYKGTIYVTLFISIISGFKQANIKVPFLSDLSALLPLYKEGLEWILPAFVTLLILTIISKMKKNNVTGPPMFI